MIKMIKPPSVCIGCSTSRTKTFNQNIQIFYDTVQKTLSEQMHLIQTLVLKYILVGGAHYLQPCCIFSILIMMLKDYQPLCSGLLKITPLMDPQLMRNVLNYTNFQQIIVGKSGLGHPPSKVVCL